MLGMRLGSASKLPMLGPFIGRGGRGGRGGFGNAVTKTL